MCLWARASLAAAIYASDTSMATQLGGNLESSRRPSCFEQSVTNRCLPNFLCVGAQKAGTSTLFELMRAHPQVLEPRKKELQFFFNQEPNSRCDPPWLRPTHQEMMAYAEDGEFPFADVLRNASAVTGEWSATYLYCWCCPMALRRVLPQVRLIVQLRHPIVRAHSRFAELSRNHWTAVSEGKAPPYYGWVVSMGFDNFALKELPILEACLRANVSNLKRIRCAARSNVLGWSVYDLFLAHWLRHMGRGRLLVTYLEDFAMNPLPVMRSIESYLGLGSHDYGSRLFGVFNARGQYGWSELKDRYAGDVHPSNWSCADLGIADQVCKALYNFYRPHLLELNHMARRGDIRAVPRSWLKEWDLA